MKELFKRPLFLLLLAVLMILIGFEVTSLRFSMAQRLISDNDVVRNKALSELQGLTLDKRQQLIAELVKQQQNAKPKPKRFSLYAIRILGGKSPEVIDALVKALADNDPHVRMEAQTSLLEIGEPSLPVVATAARSDNELVRTGALYVLEKAGALGVPYLVAMLDGRQDRLIPVVETLSRLGEAAKPAVPKLIALFSASDSNLRVDAALAANTIQRPTPEALPIFMQTLKDYPWDKKSVEVVHAIEDMGVVAKPAAPQLMRLMMDAGENFSDPTAPRPLLAQAVNELDPRRSELVDLQFDLKQKSAALRYRAAYALSVMDPPNIGALESLVGALADSDVTVVARSLLALKRIGLDKTERLGAPARAKIKSAEDRVKNAHIPGFETVY